MDSMQRQVYRNLNPEFQEQVDIVQSKPYKLIRVWDWDSEKDTWKEKEIARSKTVTGIKAYIRLHKIPTKTGEYNIYREWIEEWIDGCYPSYDEEHIEEI